MALVPCINLPKDVVSPVIHRFPVLKTSLTVSSRQCFHGKMMIVLDSCYVASATDSGYLVSFGYNETPQIIIGSLADGCCPSGQCLDQCSCENGGNELVGVDHGFGPDLTQDNSVAYLARVEVTGSLIQVWYMELDDAPGLFVASDELGDPVAEYDGADDLGPGTVGIWHESWGNGRVG